MFRFLRAYLAFLTPAFSRPSMPAAAPAVVDNSAAENKAREDAARTAAADQAMRGRRSTIVGGATIAQNEQLGRLNRRQASAEVLG